MIPVPASLALRPMARADEAFLRRLYASTRENELALVNWTGDQKEAFLNLQFSAQHKFYLEHYPQARFQIILLSDQPIGRLYVHRGPEELRLIDIALLPEHRNQGIGSFYLHRVLEEARQARLLVRLHVEPFNPARRLYERLGFRKTGENGIYFLMEWKPE